MRFGVGLVPCASASGGGDNMLGTGHGAGIGRTALVGGVSAQLAAKD